MGRKIADFGPRNNFRVWARGQGHMHFRFRATAYAAALFFRMFQQEVAIWDERPTPSENRRTP